MPEPRSHLRSHTRSGDAAGLAPVSYTAATVHAEGCRLATERAVPVQTIAALNALARPGTAACTGCDAAETLLPILRHGQDDVPDPGD